MTLEEFFTFCELRGDIIDIDVVSNSSNSVLPCVEKLAVVKTKSHTHIARIKFRDGLGQQAIEDCDLVINTRTRGRLVYPDVTLEKLIRLYLNEDLA